MAPLQKPAGWVNPLPPEVHQALDELIALEETHAYNIQQAELCGLPLPAYKARSEQRMAMARLLKTHFASHP